MLKQTYVLSIRDKKIQRAEQGARELIVVRLGADRLFEVTERVSSESSSVRRCKTH